jgi:hypothetical protein
MYRGLQRYSGQDCRKWDHIVPHVKPKCCGKTEDILCTGPGANLFTWFKVCKVSYDCRVSLQLSCRAFPMLCLPLRAPECTTKVSNAVA